MASFIAKLWMKLFIFLHFLYSTSQGESETTEQNDKMPKTGFEKKQPMENSIFGIKWKLTPFLEM